MRWLPVLMLVALAGSAAADKSGPGEGAKPDRAPDARPHQGPGTKPHQANDKQRHGDAMDKRLEEGREMMTPDSSKHRDKTMPGKEQGKGSERGQQMREEKSRKWWRFWE